MYEDRSRKKFCLQGPLFLVVLFLKPKHFFPSAKLCPVTFNNMHQTFSVALSPPVSICGVNINWRMLLWYSNFFGIQKGFFGLLFTLTIKYICYLGTHFQWARCNHLPLFAPPDQDLSMWTVLVEAHYKMHSISIDCDGNETPSPSHSLHVTMWGDAGSKYVNQELWGILYKDQ